MSVNNTKLYGHLKMLLLLRNKQFEEIGFDNVLDDFICLNFGVNINVLQTISHVDS